MIKFLILCGILSLTSYVGFQLSKTYSQKTEFYEDILSFCKSLKNEISFLKTDVVSILEKSQYKSILNDILSDIISQLKTEDILKREDVIQVLSKHNCLTEKDKDILCELFCNLGKLSYDSQLSSIDYNIENFQELLTKQTELSNKMRPLCKKMGVLIGVAVCIVLI